MYVYEDDPSTLSEWIHKEVHLANHVGIGAQGKSARRVQEWLTLQGYPVPVDGDYGVATSETVARFQEDAFLPATGKVDQDTFSRLTAPMLEAVEQRLNASWPIGEAMLVYAQAHLDKHPMEVGGPNRGPWVRMYMQGHDGPSWAWCAGFMTFLMKQAAQSIEVTELPIKGSFSCDTLVAQACAAGLFVSEDEAKTRTIPPGSWFLNRRTDTDWTHVGIVVEANELTITTIEGNTNDEGSREGFEVCMRTRSYPNRDFIVFD